MPTEPERPTASEEPPVNMLQFARDLARLEEVLVQASYSVGPNGEERSAKAASFLTLLRALTDGREPVRAIAEAIRVYHQVRQEKTEIWASRAKLEKERYERLMSEEEITRKVECPYCGAAPQTSCRSTGPSRGARTESHTGRYRLARGLDDKVWKGRTP